MMRVLLERAARAGLKLWSMALEAHRISRKDEVRRTPAAMRIVAGEAPYALRIHPARDEVVALHSVLVCGSFRPVRKGGVPELGFFEAPHAGETFTSGVAYRPVVVLPFVRVLPRLP